MPGGLIAVIIFLCTYTQDT